MSRCGDGGSTVTAFWLGVDCRLIGVLVVQKLPAARMSPDDRLWSSQGLRSTCRVPVENLRESAASKGGSAQVLRHVARGNAGGRFPSAPRTPPNAFLLKLLLAMDRPSMQASAL